MPGWTISYTLCLCILTVSVVGGDNKRYTVVPRPDDSVIPPRFYQHSPFINKLNVATLTEPDLEDDLLHMLIIVRSSPGHFDRRDAIRLTWGNAEVLKGRHKLAIIFIVGRSSDPTSHNLLLQESLLHRDLLYLDYKDTYTNLTMKDIAAFQYALKFTKRCQHLAIAGDEIVVDVIELMKYMDSDGMHHQREISFCYEFPCCTPVITDNSSKYLVQGGHYEGKLYPSYCSGTFFILRMALVDEVLHAMLDTPYFMPDDAWIGIIYTKLGIHIHDTHSHFAGISSYKKELRLLKFAQTSKFYKNKVFVVILDYAYKDIAPKIIEIWAAINTAKRESYKSGTSVYVYYSALVLLTALIVMYKRSIRCGIFYLCFSWYK